MTHYKTMIFWILLLVACGRHHAQPSHLLCYTADNCPTKAYICNAGVCESGGTECAADSDCTNPPPCQSATGATCAGGVCQYAGLLAGTQCQPADVCFAAGACDAAGTCVAPAAIVCDAPPEPTCATDSLLLVNAPIGECRLGRCSYNQREVACAQCPACLQGCVLDFNNDGAVEDVAAGTLKPDDACWVCAPESSRARWTPRSCDDGSDFSADSCDSTSGCQHTCATSSCNRLRFDVAVGFASPVRAAWPPLTVRVIDKYGDTASAADDLVSLRVTTGGGTLSGTTTVQASGGLATFADLAYDRVETVTIEVSSQSSGAATTAVLISPPKVAVAAAGWDHSCAITTNGELWCWGNNDYGQVGVGNPSQITNPTRIGSTITWRSVDLGKEHTCGISANGALWCWGHNNYGQLGLGDGSPTQVSEPTRVGSTASWRLVAAGDNHACAINENDELWCWGYNHYGELGLGDGTPAQVPSPTRVVSTLAWHLVSGGDGFTCGLSGGGLYCWGSNFLGELGIGPQDTANKSSPTQVGTETSWQQSTSGFNHNCGLKSGALLCWGYNFSGQLGLGNTTDQRSPTMVGASTSWLSVDAGQSHTCGINSGALFCWGDNTYAQLGDGTTGNPKNAPVRVGTDADWREVVAGFSHSCGIKSAGELWCFGDNTSGQLGDGSTTRRQPVQVVLP